ncbi:hypothetical protein CANMA_005436 [Candida margitis]|uniref:uncharacterized protein n=1 Tax=Candida margitis TaxID=1775924 RepID=UPI0022261566|nr:uncharacterized protein CANMA_005436 [Candida margitis]KAI5949629.1 hypothetical protein CANMA_005436 [Candida margitis]
MICLQINKVLKLQSTSPSIRLLSTSSTAHASAAASASTRSSSSSKQRSNVRNVPSLEEFLFQQRVKQVYRAVLRQIYKHHERDDLVKFMRDEFKLNANERDLNHRKYLLSLGVNRIASMSASLGLQMDL